MVFVFVCVCVGISNLDLDFVKFFIKAFKLHYVGLLHRLLILDMPWVLNAAWRIISAWLDQRAIAKIKFVNKVRSTGVLCVVTAWVLWVSED